MYGQVLLKPVVRERTTSAEDLGASALWGRWRSLVTRSLISLVILGCLIWLMQKGGLPVQPSPEAWAQLAPWSLAVFIPVWLLGTFLRLYRWLHLLRPICPELSNRRAFGVSLLGFAALFAPMRMGELARPILIARDRQIGLTQAIGTVAAERIVDGVMLMSILGVGLLTTTRVAPPPYLSDLVAHGVQVAPGVASGMLVFFLSAFAALVLFYFWRSFAERIVFALVGLVSKPLAHFITAQVERFADSLKFLFSPRHGSAFLRETVGYWALSAISFLVLLRGVGVPATLSQACVMMGVLGLSTLLPGPPGFFGTYQIGAYVGIAMFFPARLLLAGVVFTFISYVVQLATAGLCLAIGLWLLARSERPVPSVSESQRPEPPSLVSTSSR